MTPGSNVRWVLVNQAGRVFIQLISVVVFSRLLTPADYGLMAMAIVVMNFGFLFRDMGTTAALIQRKEVTPRLLDTVFWMNVAFGVTIAVSIAGTSPFVAWVFSAPLLIGILLLLAIVFPIVSATAPYLAMMERSGRFRTVARIEISSELLGLLVGILVALNGGGVFSFVWQRLAATVISTPQLLLTAKWRPSLAFSRDEFRKVWSYSSNLVFFNLLLFLFRNADSALVGRFLGATSLGWYSVANRLLLFPLQNLSGVMSRALLPIYSNRQEELSHVSSLYLRSLAAIAAISAPMMAGLWVLREPFINALMGPGWGPVSDILAWFAPMGLFQSLTATTGTILAAIGRTDVLRTLGIVNTALFLCSFVLGLQFGLLGLAAAYFCATIIVAIISLHVTLIKVNSNLLEMIARIAVPIGCALAMAGAMFALDRGLLADYHALARVVVASGVGAALYAALLLAFARPLVTSITKSMFR